MRASKHTGRSMTPWDRGAFYILFDPEVDASPNKLEMLVGMPLKLTLAHEIVDATNSETGSIMLQGYMTLPIAA